MKSHISGKNKAYNVLPPFQQPLQSYGMLLAAAEKSTPGTQLGQGQLCLDKPAQMVFTSDSGKLHLHSLKAWRKTPILL